jgi:hypothetical protein
MDEVSAVENADADQVLPRPEMGENVPQLAVRLSHGRPSLP